MNLLVNGERTEVLTSTDITLKEVLEYLGCTNEFVAVAVNMACIPKSLYEATWLRENDELEILTPMQGG